MNSPAIPDFPSVETGAYPRLARARKSHRLESLANHVGVGKWLQASWQTACLLPFPLPVPIRLPKVWIYEASWSCVCVCRRFSLQPPPFPPLFLAGARARERDKSTLTIQCLRYLLLPYVVGLRVATGGDALASSVDGQHRRERMNGD